MSAPEPNTFSGSTLDRAGPERQRPEWVAARLADPLSRAIVLATGGPMVVDGADGPVPAQVPLAELLERLGALAGAPDDGGPDAAPVPLLLGAEPDGRTLWALDVGGADPLGLGLPAAAAPVDLREVAATLSDEDAGRIALARSLAGWHRHHRFCANCGTLTEVAEAGHLRRCPGCGAAHHPRLDPVVIMLVTDGDRALLGRQERWPPGRWSALAGFVETGESLESAVAREVAEEAGVLIGPPVYHSSQPWPFPSQLMVGFHAPWAGGDPAPADGELEGARWFSRTELRSAVAGEAGAVDLPGRQAIARRLVEHWLRA